MSMNPRTTTEKIREDYEEYISSILLVKDQQITHLAREQVKNSGFVKGPYLETTLPFENGKSLSQLAEEGLVSKEFSVMGQDVHYSDWMLRVHQEEALRKVIAEERNIVVATGTGSGKTECYLYPVINSLMREKENVTLCPGVRALLIFPMNALANDQQKKLRKLLRNYPDITFGRYTRETPRKTRKETIAECEQRLHREYNAEHRDDHDSALRSSIPNEIMSREAMTENPPHILLTNYAMLEYLLLRPDTAPFFYNESASHWRFIVIDEAHTYKGATGTEIAFLLRRLKERIRHHMHESFRCIATSATLGSEDGKKGLAEFAENLFDEPFSAEDVITTRRIQRVIPSDARRFLPDEYDQLKQTVAEKTEGEKGILLYQALSKDRRLFDIYDALNKKPKKVEEVADTVFPDISDRIERENALITLIELAAAARMSENESALFPARYHLFVKSLEGMFAQLYPQRRVFLDRKENVADADRKYSVFELANCQKCEQEYLVGKTLPLEDGTAHFVQTNDTAKPEFYFVSSDDVDSLQLLDEDDALEETEKHNNLRKFRLCLSCGRITPFEEIHPMDCCACDDSHKIVTVYQVMYIGKDHESNRCPCCGATQKGLIKRFLTANQPSTFAIAKSLYEAIPPRPQNDDVGTTAKANDPDDFFDDLFLDDTDYSTAEEVTTGDERGRKLLIFSDNRQEAAHFAGFFEKKYNQTIWRRAIIDCLKGAGETVSIVDLINRVMRSAEKSGIYTMDLTKKVDLTDDQKREMAAHYIMQEFLTPDRATGLEGMGLVAIEPVPQRVPDSFRLGSISGSELWDVLRFFMDTLRQKGAVSYPDIIRATDDFFFPTNQAGYFRDSGSKNDYAGHVYGFIPQPNTMNKRLSFLCKLESETDSKADDHAIPREELRQLYDKVLQLARKGYLIKTSLSSLGTVYCLNYAKWGFRYIQETETMFRCNKCGKSFSYSIRNLCPEMKCTGTLEPVEARELRKIPYYGRLYTDSKLIPMVAREHTAQLSQATAADYQKDFEEGKINVLSCSTTFEMGVDVGELEATFQRNVPPETSNYIQRAGRAGRRTSSAAFSVTFARRNSHDMTFFHDPAKIIAGKIDAPILEVNNEKIAERHLNSIVVAWFFKQHPEYFRENTLKIVSLEDGRDMAVALKESLDRHPEGLLKSIHDVFPDGICRALGVDEWRFIDSLTGNDGSLTRAIAERSEDIKGLFDLISSERSSNPYGKIKATGRTDIAAERLIATLQSEPSINFLSSKGVLPKYGFPIDTVSLDILSGDTEEAKKIDLSRDLRMAISEFAPPSQIVANGHVWQSYAINTVPGKSWPAYVYHECPKCKWIAPPIGGMVTAEVDLKEIGVRECPVCREKMNPKVFIIPLFGFSTKIGDKPKPVGDTRPSTYYSTRTQFWGIEDLTEREAAEAKQRDVLIHGKQIETVYSPGGKLFILNQGRGNGGLKVCTQCGFATDFTSAIGMKKHETKYRRLCGHRDLRTVSLGNSFSTDILKVTLPEHFINMDMPAGTTPKNQLISVLYALLEGASKALDISRDDIDGCVTENNTLVLYDDTPGGSGFVKSIYARFEDVLRAAKQVVSGSCGCAEETSCYGCLRNYRNQYYHDEISRGLAYRYLSWLLSEVATEKQTLTPSKEVPAQAPAIDPVWTKGTLQSHYRAGDSSMEPDTEEALLALRDYVDSDEDKNALTALSCAARGMSLEHPLSETPIDLPDQKIWPDLLWGNSHVAFFIGPEQDKQYEVLKKYDWYCIRLSDVKDPVSVLKLIKKENV